MLDRFQERFASEGRVEMVGHDLERPLPALGTFDVIASSFAIHHLPHPRKRELYQEVWAALEPGGVICNLEHVSSPSARPLEQAARRGDTTPVAEGDRVRGRGLLLEVAGTGPARRQKAGRVNPK